MRLATRVLRGLSFLATLGLIPAVANAEDPATVYTRSWTMCSAGAIRSCHSVTLQTQGTFSGTTRVGTSVVLSLRNLQGQNAVDNMAWSTLTAVRIYRSGALGTTASTSTTPSLAGGATGTPTGWNWSTDPANTTWGILRLLSTSTGRIGGCATATGAAMYTCPGSVVFSIASSQIFNADQFSELRMDWAGPSGSGNCASENIRNQAQALCDLENTSVTTTVTPEPITMALLGTGLLGVGGARLRRRSKEEV